jgi:hypothetical protein
MNPFYAALQAPALGVYSPARFNEPDNPFAQQGPCLGCLGEYIPSTFADRGMGQLRAYVRAQFTEPQNPFPAGGLGCLSCGGGLGQASTPDPNIDFSQIATSLSSAVTSLSQYQVAGIPILYLAAGAAAALLVFHSQTTSTIEKHAKRLSAKATYLKSKVRARQSE